MFKVEELKLLGFFFILKMEIITLSNGMERKINRTMNVGYLLECLKQSVQQTASLGARGGRQSCSGKQTH